MEKPFIHKPNRHEATGDELFCVYHDDRLCNAACVAFDVHGVRDDMRTSCILVNAQMQLAASLAVLAKSVKTLAKKGDIPGSNLSPPGVL